ncbi:hypothetical protein [Rhodothermus profundi]|uniref:Uncharacterized protein n=1 Tax=Rhodothermus profundi TaxID=633813 RepID=A0A1M6UMS9_9BACT|nr:hypothetical protein [Rhodothermus profundi]SHK70400.1 hypothetical protein SAMN04488087_1776 [Rhodothermus profundi]
MSAAWKIGLGLLLVALSWGLYGWQTQQRLPQVPFPSEAFVPVWSPRGASSATAVARGEVLLFFSPDECGQTVARTAAFWMEGSEGACGVEANRFGVGRLSGR